MELMLWFLILWSRCGSVPPILPPQPQPLVPPHPVIVHQPQPHPQSLPLVPVLAPQPHSLPPLQQPQPPVVPLVPILNRGLGNPPPLNIRPLAPQPGPGGIVDLKPCP